MVAGGRRERCRGAAATYLVQTRMAHRHGEGLLVDPGAHDDLTGDRWVQRFSSEAARAGQPLPVLQPLANALSVGGVGKGRQQADRGVTCKLGVAGKPWTFQAPMLPESDVPALLGVRTLKKQRAVMDCFTGRLYLIGAGGYKMSLSPGSQELKLHEAHSGHWILPCTDWAGADHRRTPTTASLSATSLAVLPATGGVAVE